MPFCVDSSLQIDRQPSPVRPATKRRSGLGLQLLTRLGSPAMQGFERLHRHRRRDNSRSIRAKAAPPGSPPTARILHSPGISHSPASRVCAAVSSTAVKVMAGPGPVAQLAGASSHCDPGPSLARGTHSTALVIGRNGQLQCESLRVAVRSFAQPAPLPVPRERPLSDAA